MSRIARSPSGRSSNRIAFRFGSKRSPLGRRWSMAKPRVAAARPDAKSQDSAWPAADFHRATRPPAASRHDARREPRRAGETPEASARPADDARAAPGAGRRSQLLAGAAGFPAHLPGALREHGRRGRSERRVARDSNARRRASDAGEESARPRPAGADLSGVSGPRRFGADHHFHHLHGAAVDEFHVANRRQLALADADLGWRQSSHHRLLVGLCARRDRRRRRVPRFRPERRGTDDLGSISPGHSGLRP